MEYASAHRGAAAAGADRRSCQRGEQLSGTGCEPRHRPDQGHHAGCGEPQLCLGLSPLCLTVDTVRGAGGAPQPLPRICTRQGEAVLIADGARRIIATNRAFSELSGFSEEEVMGRDALLLKSGREPRALQLSIWRSLSRDGYWQGELLGRRRDGSFYPKWLRLSVVRNLAGQIVIYIARFHDISDRGEAAG